MVKNFDLIVVGSGSGLDVANAASSRGLKVAIVEKGPLGGTCLNRGCIPSKMLIHSADVIDTISKARTFGIQIEGYKIDFPAIIERVTKAVDGDADSIEQSFRTIDNPKLFKQSGKFVGMKRLRLDDGEEITAEKILIASGGRPKIPEIEGLNVSGFLTSDDALRLKKQPKVMTILGGGYIAIELGHFYGSLGTKINIVQHHDVLIPNEDEEISRTFTELFRRKYNVFTGYEPVKVARRGSEFELIIRSAKDGKTTTLVSDQLLVVTGRVPNSDELDITKTGVNLDKRGFVLADEFLETNVKGIFALGDAVGHFLFKHSANLEAEYDFNNILDPEHKVAVDYTAIPHAIFSSPQIAGVGKTEQELKKDGTPYAVGKYSYINTGMGEAINDTEGFVKFLVEPQSGKILGCHIIGTDASTLIHEVLVAMKSGDGTVGSITRTVHIHPALSEVVQRAAANIGQMDFQSPWNYCGAKKPLKKILVVDVGGNHVKILARGTS